MNSHDQAEFGSRLKTQRESRALSIVDVAKTTKIPEHQILKLEHGRFDDLPAEVFVRGFLKSYCRAVGLDVDETLRAYGSLARRPSRFVSLTRPSLAHGSIDGVPAEVVEEAVAAAVARAQGGHASRPVAPVATPASTPQPQPHEEAPPEQSLLAAISHAGRGISRTSLTLAVIILVIVATLTLSLLLRRPSHVGDGYSARDAAARAVG
ncbi:MAG TPA: helix-turn-helix domain-containing protein [Haliangiales bacterium]|nr:helix-turn-helix domain-containing protein [Haliangiales bacterium]